MINNNTKKTKPAIVAPWVHIVIVAYNSGDDLQNCIDALARQTSGNFQVVIVDNVTPDNCIKDLQIPDFRFKILTAKENLGFSGGSNYGLAGALTPWVMTLNPDVVLHQNCLQYLKKACGSYPKAEMVSPVLLRAEQPGRFDGAGDVLSIFGIAWRGGYNEKITATSLTQTQCVFAPCGAAALYRRDVFEQQNGFDSAFFCYLEDVDLALRINASGGTCILAHDAIAFHIGGATTGKISGFQDYYTCRNNLRMIIKSIPLALMVIMLTGYGASQIWITFRNLKDPRTSARIRGYRDAIKGIPSAIKARWKRPRYKFGSSLHLSKKLVWRKKYLRQRSIHTWPVDANLK